jgi:hypothetical protein
MKMQLCAYIDGMCERSTRAKTTEQNTSLREAMAHERGALQDMERKGKPT